ARRAMQAEPAMDRALAEALAGQLYNAGVKLNNGARPSEAIVAFEEALQLDRDARGVRDAAFRATLRDATLQVARYLVASGHPTDAAAACRLRAERTPPGPGAKGVRGSARRGLQNPEEARAAFESAAQDDPASAEAAAGVGEARRRQGTGLMDR